MAKNLSENFRFSLKYGLCFIAIISPPTTQQNAEKNTLLRALILLQNFHSNPFESRYFLGEELTALAAPNWIKEGKRRKGG